MIRTWQFRVSRFLGKLITRIAAILTLGRMPPFVSTSAIVVSDGCVLTVFDPIRHEPILPGGHLRWRESPEAAVIREVYEETGISIQPSRLLGVFSGYQWAGEEGIVRIIYLAEAIGGSLSTSPEGVPAWRPLSIMAASDTRDATVLRCWLEQPTPT